MKHITTFPSHPLQFVNVPEARKNTGKSLKVNPDVSHHHSSALIIKKQRKLLGYILSRCSFIENRIAEETAVALYLLEYQGRKLQLKRLLRGAQILKIIKIWQVTKLYNMTNSYYFILQMGKLSVLYNNHLELKVCPINLLHNKVI